MAPQQKPVSDVCVYEVEEPLLTEQPGRYSLFPIQDHEIFSAYKRAQSSYWTVDEVDLSRDKKDFDNLTPAEQHFLTTVLAFFATADALVNENLFTNFTQEVQLQEAKLCYAFQAAIESVHSEQYSLLIDTLVSDSALKKKLFDSVLQVPVVQKKAEWITKWFDPSANAFNRRLIAFACVEGILFSSSFCAIYYFKKRGVMPGLCLSNEFIARDESEHTQFAVLLNSKLIQPAPEKEVHDIVRSAVEVEHVFVDEALGGDLLGINASEMKQYVCFVADQLLVALNCSKLYNVPNAFDFMQNISLNGKSNFFETRESMYSKSGVGVDLSEQVFATDCDF